MNMIDDKDEEIRKEFNAVPIGGRLAFLYKLYEDVVYIREDAWFHYQDGLSYEIKDVSRLELLGQLLKEMSENDGKMKS